MCWDITVICPLAKSYVRDAAIEEGAEAEVAASRKENKYADLGSRYIFEPIAVKTLCVFAPIANLKVHYFQPSLSVCVCVCLTGSSTLHR